jgi:hypothetical protein
MPYWEARNLASSLSFRIDRRATLSSLKSDLTNMIRIMLLTDSPLEVRISRLNPGDSASAVFICEVPYSPPTNYRYVLHIPEGSIEVPGSFTVDTSDPRTSLTTTGYIDVCLLRRETLVRSLSVTTSTITINTVVVPVVSIETIQTTEMQALECGG